MSGKQTGKHSTTQYCIREDTTSNSTQQYLKPGHNTWPYSSKKNLSPRAPGLKYTDPKGTKNNDALL